MERQEGNKKEEPEEIPNEYPPVDDGEASLPLASSTPITTKRRGRPPKSANKTEKISKSGQTPEPKSYPKRNRKTPARLEHYDKGDEENTSTLSSPLSSKDDISQDSTKDSNNDTELVGKPKQGTGRKRGRPRKTLQESVEETPTPKRKRASLKTGEDREDKNDDKDNSLSVKTGTRRGRRKLKEDDDISDDSEEEKDKSGVNKSGRGEQQIVSDPDTPRSTGRRGRKANQKKAEKSPTISSGEETGEEREVTPMEKSKGRGEKSKITKEDNESEMTCLRCQQKFPNLSALKNHLMRRHTALYSPDCPEGKEDRASVRQILKIRKILYCPKCDKELRNAQYYFKHTEWCGREAETFTCTVCNRSCMKMYELEHYRNHKLLERKEKERQEQLLQLQKKKREEEKESGTDKQGRRIRKAAKKAVRVLKDISASGDVCTEGNSDEDPEVRLDVDEDEEDQEEDDDEDLDEDVSDESINSHSELDGVDEDCQSARGRKGKRPQSSDMFREVYVHCCKNYLKRCQVIDKMCDVFPELRPKKSQWILQNPKEAEEFLPVTRESVRFRVISPEKKGETPPLTKLNRFEAEFRTGTYNLFAGGPVWGLAWCPVPHNVKCDQYLAVSCHREMVECHETKSLYFGKGAIQLWNIGELNSLHPKKSMSSSVPYLEFCISHSFGVIYQLCWCPSNAWESSDNEASVQLPRLGLLAGAFSDGNVHIYSLPQPASLNLENLGNELAVFKPEPVFTLIPYPLFKQEKAAPCLCIDWQQKFCQFLAAGYGDGSIRVWDLKSQSSLLRVVTTPTIKLLPFYSTVAHNDCVMSLKWSPHVTDKFATASRDRTFVIWDLNNRHFPIYKTLAQMALSVYWLPFNFCVLQGMDDCYSNLETYVRSESYDHIVKDNGTQSDPVVVLSDCIWGLTCSNWLMVILATNNSGNVVGSVMPHLRRKEVQRFHRRPVTLFETEVQEKDFDEEHISGQKELLKKGNKRNADPTVFKSYESGKNKIYLEYKECDPFQPKKKVPKITVTADDVRGLAFRAVYRIEMNPNIQSCVWVASGGQAGIVRIHNVAQHLIPTAVQDLKDVRSSLNIT
ncbi:general transcription factor 3C polypeptide 2-like [Saccostrea echinata]|uniref:general transcription factor 3C polypeptide 2-like n=1 Tax=Saccostrea echinata TaxID=191078 RepID=UPI002A7F05D8|nr:general transcription factor 3C polypeptide 2-like [Saccostrea echinata]